MKGDRPVGRSMASLLASIGFLWAAIVPVSMGPFLERASTALSRSAIGSDAVITVWTVEHLHSLRMRLMLAAPAVILVGAYCVLRRVDHLVLVSAALAVTLVIASAALVVMTLAGLTLTLL